MMKRFVYLLILIPALPLLSCTESGQVSSPDRSISVHTGVESGRLFYTVSKNGDMLLDKSFLGFTLADGPLGDHVVISGITHTSFSSTWDQTWGEEIVVDNTYNQMTVHVEEKTGPQRKFDVVFRLFDDGFGFRYEFPEQPHLEDFTIMDEHTEFNFPGNHKAWSIPYGASYYEALYEPHPLNELDTVCTPLTIETDEGLYLALHEANLTDYAAMN